MTGVATPQDIRWLGHAIDLSRRCAPSATAYNVGAVVVAADGNEIASGYSRDTNPYVHAEESVLGRIPPDDPRIAAATLYSTLEPCTERRSRTPACTDLILVAGISRVVIAWREPALFVAECAGIAQLRAAGVSVLEVPELARAARIVNAHLRGLGPP